MRDEVLAIADRMALQTSSHSSTRWATSSMVCSARRSMRASTEQGTLHNAGTVWPFDAKCSVARDFVEAPSQMLENWCWEPKVLEKMSSHYESKKPLSPELIDKIIKSRYVNVGLFYLRQLFFAKFDLKIHTDQDKEDYTELWSSLREKISLVKSGKPCPGQGTFGHITGGYDAGYYGYTYSLVFAADMYGELGR